MSGEDKCTYLAVALSLITNYLIPAGLGRKVTLASERIQYSTLGGRVSAGAPCTAQGLSKVDFNLINFNKMRQLVLQYGNK